VGFSGFDAVSEASVALGTYSSNYWDPALGVYSTYQSSLAVTILPSILGRAVEVPADLALLFQDFILMAMLPVAVQAVTSRIAGNTRLGALSGVLIATNWFFFGEHLIGKTEAALLLCTLSVYCLSRKENSLRSLGVFIGVGVVMSHYTIGLYYSSILLVLVLWTLVGGRIVKNIRGFKALAIPSFSTWKALLAIAVVALWLDYAAPVILPKMYSTGLQVLSGLTSAGQKRADTSLFLGSPAGLLITLWFDFQNGLLGLGALLAINYYRKGRIVGGLANWTVAGIGVIVAPLAWIVLPGLSVQVESTRIIEMILPLSILLLAQLLVRVHASPGKTWKGGMFLIVFLLVPMNLMLLNPTEVLYHQPDTLSLEKRLDLDSSYLPTFSNYAMANWVSDHVPPNNSASTSQCPTPVCVEADSVALYAFQTALRLPTYITPVQEDFPPTSSNRYAVLSFYFVNDNTWSKASLGTRTLIIQPPTPFFQSTRNTVYASPRFWIATSPS
jgi:hypothetical protein